jgi:cold shock CspA family protein
LLIDVVKNRKKLPIFVIDNTDEFDLDYKVSVFQYFQSLRRSAAHCLLIFPATDRSAWTFSKTDIFNIYSSRSFFLPTPPPREVFRKRIEYLKNKIGLSDSGKTSREYFSDRGIKIQIRDLDAFARVVEDVFVEQDYPSKIVGELSNYNMRKALGLAKRIITSSVLKIEDLIRTYLTGTMVAPTHDRFMNALIKGDYEFFRSGDEPLLTSVFQVDGKIRQSPLIHVRILAFLNGLHQAASRDGDRYVTVGSIKSYFDVMSMSEVSLQKSLEVLLLSGLIEPYDLSKKDYSEDQRVAISESGVLHLHLAMFNPVYFEQMALTTRILDADVARAIHGTYKSHKSLNERLDLVRKLFCQYLVQEDGRFCVLPGADTYRIQGDVVAHMVGRWVGSNGSGQSQASPTAIGKALKGVIDRFDQSRGFGFVEISSLKDSAFLHISVLEQGGFHDVAEGDVIICDLERNDKGIVVSNIIEITKVDRPALRGIVAKIFEDRSYGFVYVPETGADAFFHFQLLSLEQKNDLYEGQELLVEVSTDQQGRSQVRKILDQLPVPESLNAVSHFRER